MTISRAVMLAAVGEQYKRALTDKQSECYTAMQYIADDIADYFRDFRGFKTDSGWLPCTVNVATVDVSTALANLYGNRIEAVSLRDTTNSSNDRTLTEIDYEDEYLQYLPDESDTTGVSTDIPSEYARYGDNVFLKSVPDSSNYSIKLFFEMNHPTIDGTQGFLYPSDFQACIMSGILWYLYMFVERKDQLAERHFGIYEGLREQKIEKYKQKPNAVDQIRYNW